MLLISNLKFKEETIHNISNNEQLLGIDDLKHLTLDDIMSLVTYQKHIALGDSTDGGESLIQSVLKSYSDNDAKFSRS